MHALASIKIQMVIFFFVLLEVGPAQREGQVVGLLGDHGAGRSKTI